MEFNNPNRVRERQIFFQKPSQHLVYLRGGPRDKAVFGVLCGLIAVGSVGAAYKMVKNLLNKSPWFYR